MLETKRRVIGQMIVCQGWCCGATQKDRPEVPVERLKAGLLLELPREFKDHLIEPWR